MVLCWLSVIYVGSAMNLCLSILVFFYFFLGIVLNYVYLKLLGKNEYSNSFVTYYMYGVI